MADSRIRKASEILASFFNGDISRKTGIYSSFFNNWAEFAGLRCSAHSKVENIFNNILIISVDHPAWIQLLQFNQHGILEKVKKKYPELCIKGISFRVKIEKGKENDQAERYFQEPQGDGDILIEEAISEIGISDDLYMLDTGKTINASLDSIRDDPLRLALARLQDSIKQKTEKEKKTKKSKN